jgi:RNA polymerase sigma-70 factor (ECF subfamily)
MKPDEERLRGLMVQGLEGDPLAYRTFLLELGAVLDGFARRRLLRLGRSDSDAEDIVQETLIAIHSRRHTYDRALPVTAWAHAIARYKLIDYLRANAAEAEELRLEDIADTAADGAMPRDQALSLRKIIAALPERFRAPITLMKVEGLSVAETASRTGMTKAAVKTNVHRGMKWIARMIAGAKQ